MVPRLVLRMLLDREVYADFCSTVRKINVQPLCGYCNNFKATRVIDLRDDDIHQVLISYLDKYGIAESVVFEDPDAFVKEVMDG